MNIASQFFSGFKQLSKNSVKNLENIFTIQNFKKGDNIAGVHQNEVKFFFLLEGVAGSYLTDKKEKNYIRTLFTPLDPIVSLSAFVTQDIVDISYQCLTDCVFLQADYKTFKEVLNKHPDISTLYIEILETSYAKLLNRVTDLTILNGTERYLKLKKQIPNIENLIPQYHIASFLNISPVQLSRIRKEMYSK